MKVFQKPTVHFLQDCPFSYVETFQQFLLLLRTKEYFENGKSGQWAFRITEKEQGLAPGVSHLLIRCLFPAKPVGAVIATVCCFVEKVHERSGTSDHVAGRLTYSSRPRVCV